MPMDFRHVIVAESLVDVDGLFGLEKVQPVVLVKIGRKQDSAQATLVEAWREYEAVNDAPTNKSNVSCFALGTVEVVEFIEFVIVAPGYLLDVRIPVKIHLHRLGGIGNLRNRFDQLSNRVKAYKDVTLHLGKLSLS